MSSNENIKVSVIVPCYNYGRFLGECLDSVIAQTFAHWECIVIDNGSTDNTGEVAQAYAAREPRIKYHHTEQCGVSGARNMAVKLSKGQYILPLDADDKIAASYLSKAVKEIESRSGVKAVYCDARLFGASSGKWVLPPFSLRDLLIENSIFCTALYRKSDFEKSGGYNEEMREGFEDWDFWIRMLGSGGGVYKIPEELFFYRIRAASRNSSIDLNKQLELRRRIYASHKDLYDQHFDLPALLFENYRLKNENASYSGSREYNLGRALLAPLRYIKKMFRSA